MVNSVWASDRLQYMSVEPHHEPFLARINSDPISFLNSAPLLPVPQCTKKSATGVREWLEKCLLGVVACLPADKAKDGDNAEPTPIGYIALNPGGFAHHHNASIAITIVGGYRGQGYGSEMIKWALHWGFRYGNLHRIEIGCYERNPGAKRLYERLGFVLEGTLRKKNFSSGRYWDQYELAMLIEEYEELYGKAEREAEEAAAAAAATASK